MFWTYVDCWYIHFLWTILNYEPVLHRLGKEALCRNLSGETHRLFNNAVHTKNGLIITYQTSFRLR